MQTYKKDSSPLAEHYNNYRPSSNLEDFMSLKNTHHVTWLWLLVTLLISASAMAEDLKPFVLGKTVSGEMSAAAAETKAALEGQGFTIAGEYSPYPDAHVIVVTSDELKATAGKTENGGFGAAERVSLTKAGDSIQIAYVNPAYMAAAFRMDGNLAGVAKKLAAALGEQESFGAEKGLSEKKLRKYHYMIAMPYFDDVDELASFDSYTAAVDHIEKRLAAGTAGATKVYRIDIPGKEETLFGVAISTGDGADKSVMSITDTGELKHTAHLPYELLVTGNEAIALAGKFRIAVSFPDLGMGTFMKISSAPGAISDVLGAVAGSN